MDSVIECVFNSAEVLFKKEFLFFIDLWRLLNVIAQIQLFRRRGHFQTLLLIYIWNCQELFEVLRFQVSYSSPLIEVASTVLTL